MIGEGAAQTCASIAADIRLIRSSGCLPPQAMSESVARLLTAPATTAIDALALAAMSKKILSYVVEQFGEDPSLFNDTEMVVAFSMALVSRAVAILEIETGFSAEGFTGEVDATN